jgi:biopolymer transport protein ExbB/TolQ
MWAELALSFKQGNTYVLALFGIGFISAMIFFERFVMVQFVYNLNFDRFLLNIRRAIAAEDLDRAVSLCKNAGRTSLPLIALKALEAAESDPTTVRGAIEEETIHFLPRLEARLTLLPALATLAMMIGVLGTLEGIWSTFHSIDVLDSAKKQATIAKGLAGSLNPMAMGILISALTICAQQILRGYALRVIERVHLGVSVLNNLLVPSESTAFVPIAAAGMGGGMGGSMSGAGFGAGGAHGGADSGKGAENASGATANATPVVTASEDIKDEEEII